MDFFDRLSRPNLLFGWLFYYTKISERTDVMDILKILTDNGIEVLQDKQEAVKSAVGKSVNNCMFGGLPHIEITAR